MKKPTTAFGLTAFLLVTVPILAVSVFVFDGYLAHAATITVNTTADELNTDGDCSLREAIEATNTNAAVDACPAGEAGPTVDTITFSVTGTITLTSGQLTVSDDLTIDGPGAANMTISGNDASRVLEVDAGVTANFEGVTVADGFIDYPLGGAGVFNAGTLTVTNTTFSGNSANQGGGAINNGLDATATVTDSTLSQNSGGFGGGISNNGTLMIANSTVSGNSSSGTGGGIHSDGTLTIVNSFISGNSGGGGISNDGTLTLTNSTISGNSSFGNGGGIFQIRGTATLTNSAISGNSAPSGGGGGIWDFDGTLVITNSTFSANVASGAGGAIFTAQPFPPIPKVTITSSTLSANSANTGGGIFSPVPIATLRNTIVANSPSGGNCAGPITDGGGNLQHPGTDCGATIPSADPLLGPLADNGGPTQTHALLTGSPAIDAASPPCPPPSTDQRGVGRPQGPACDIGAFELEAGPACPVDDNDFDSDGTSNKRDKDDDNDGIRDGPDTDDDNDSIPDRQDPDDDNDGIPDNKDKDDGQPFCPG